MGKTNLQYLGRWINSEDEQSLLVAGVWVVSSGQLPVLYRTLLKLAQTAMRSHSRVHMMGG